ncbi:MAG: phosphatidate cytidylyltransferase [Bacillota bacterium]|nr:phosphatidate cytidylyltransferase [Bacillota bacterium]
MKQRIITAVIAAALFLPIVIYGGVPIIILAYLLATVGLYEFLKMRKLEVLSVPGAISFLVLWVTMLPQEYQHILNVFYFSKTELAIMAVFLYLIYTVATKNRFTFDDVAFSVFAALYVGIGFYSFYETRHNGLLYIFYSLFIIWATDSGAYFVGKAMGKNKLWPEISPNKTVEGSVGGVVCAIAVAALFILLTDIHASFWQLVGITALLSIFGQLGDLVESAFKRHYNVKDSGSILPGHGGILDRFDSLLFVWPLLHFFHLL